MVRGQFGWCLVVLWTTQISAIAAEVLETTVDGDVVTTLDRKQATSPLAAVVVVDDTQPGPETRKGPRRTAQEHQEALYQWLRDNGGYVRDGLEFRHYNDDLSLPLGLFTSQAIDAHQVLFEIPRVCTIHSGDYCTSGRILQREIERVKNEEKSGQANDKESSSFFAPYIHYLLDTQPLGQLPCVFSDAGKVLLDDMLKNGEIPPLDATNWDFLEYCDIQEPQESFAFQLIRQRSWDDMMLPLYDILSHTNDPEKYNTECDAVQGVDRIQVRASRDIAAGEELAHSYTRYPEAGDLHEYYGTPDIVKDFGFVEQYPQRWFFVGDGSEFGVERDVQLRFEVHKNKDTGLLQVEWLSPLIEQEDFNYGLSLLEWMKEFATERLDERDEAIPEREWDLIVQYNHAFITAVDTALLSLAFDNLVEEEGSLEYSLGYYTCNRKWVDPEFFSDYEEVDNFKSHYQHHRYTISHETHDACFSLVPHVQMCTCFRPHHHEVSVHYAARYLDKVERVLWVGGGDSMLLHDILTYPTVKKVVGLELDQMVTRYNFKHLGVQPHWDMDKVEWWYGDATKSLLMLPKEYFGSFDLILMDLSDTVMELSVTGSLDIFGAMALLLKKGGVIVKNEHYLEQFSRVFPYVIQINYEDVPVICHQPFVLGSYDLDLLHAEPKDHGILDQTLFFKNRKDVQGRFDIWHDYRFNFTNANAHCKKNDATDLESQTQSPGILMIVEAEDVAIKLTSTTKVAKALTEALIKSGLNVMESNVPTDAEIAGLESYTISIVMVEGYLVSHIYPEPKYVGFDLHLWGSYGKQETAKRNLISAVGSGKKEESTSSFRIVAGGMFGVETWKEDQINRGPRYHDCEESIKPNTRGVFTDTDTADKITSELLHLIDSASINAFVVCGERPPCSSLESIKANQNVGKIIPIWTCVNNTDGFDSSRECESQVFGKLMNEVEESGRRFDAIIFDTSVPFMMGRVVLRVLSLSGEVRSDQSILLQPDCIIIANSVDVTKTWRRAMLDRIRRDVLYWDPVFRAELLLNTTDESMEVGLVLGGDKLFISHFYDLIKRVENEYDLVSDFRNIQGANFSDQEDDEYEPLFYAPDAFDQTDNVEQWTTQQPLGYQTISQLEVETPEDTLAVGNIVEVIWGDGQTYKAKILHVHPDDSADVEYFGGNIENKVNRMMITTQRSQFELQLITEASQLFEGDMVEVSLPDESEKTISYNGLVTAINDDGTFDIFYPETKEEGHDIDPTETETFRRIVTVTSESPPSTSAVDTRPNLSCAMIKDSLKYALSVLADTLPEINTAQTSEFTSLGDGCLVVAVWKAGGSVSALWDGRFHVDLNLYFSNVESRAVADLFLLNFKNGRDMTEEGAESDDTVTIPKLRTVLRDEMPRGIGRVVNFQRDLDQFEEEEPLWTQKTNYEVPYRISFESE